MNYWDIENGTKTKTDAASYGRLLQDPQFTVTVSLTVSQVILSFLDAVTNSLQKKDCNIADAYHDVALAKECIRDAREDTCWEKVWKKQEQVATAVNVTMMKPRTTSVQSHPANAAGNRIEQNPSEYYRVNVYYPFIDHVLAELETRFSEDHKGLIAAQNLVPVHLKLCTRFSTTDECLSDLTMMLIPRGTNYMPTTKDIYEQK